MAYTPQQGDIVFINFDPRIGHEQKGRRPGLIISNNDYHKRTGMAMVCPITSTISGFPTHVALDDRTNTAGAIMCEQVKSLDLNARQAEYVEFLPDDLIDEVIDLICSFIE